MSNYIEPLRKQHELEKLAREAEKMEGIINALDMAILESRGSDPQSFGGAFTAAADIAARLKDDLYKVADRQEETA